MGVTSRLDALERALGPTSEDERDEQRRLVMEIRALSGDELDELAALLDAGDEAGAEALLGRAAGTVGYAIRTALQARSPADLYAADPGHAQLVGHLPSLAGRALGPRRVNVGDGLHGVVWKAAGERRYDAVSGRHEPPIEEAVAALGSIDAAIAGGRPAEDAINDWMMAPYWAGLGLDPPGRTAR